jgi:sec-independent protein translocase protein TatA
MVGLDNPLHIALVLVVVLLVFGAKRLPEMGKSMGSGLRGFKQALSGEEHAEPVTQTISRSSTTAPDLADHEHVQLARELDGAPAGHGGPHG